ncbi:hypothetical protein [Escherichia phage P762]|uniref:Uncharacterized protein n=1 Tax=Escherichia phage vB_EcoP_IMEP24 TaxID=2866662 RepID=A0AAE9C0V7_9CAUD|nr:hypothetical protein [Escherichia phage P762]UCR92062.1 hypothetical protein [Escherichia phage vB_EcoP_IMEP24]
MDGVPRHMRYYVGNTGKNRRSKLKERLKREVPDANQRAAVLAIMEEYAILYHLKFTKE